MWESASNWTICCHSTRKISLRHYLTDGTSARSRSSRLRAESVWVGADRSLRSRLGVAFSEPRPQGAVDVRIFHAGPPGWGGRSCRLPSGTHSMNPHMEEALDLAARGGGRVSPNPGVRAVLGRDGAVVGRGFYTARGVKHAEILALEEAAENTGGATMYVTLEPHS